MSKHSGDAHYNGMGTDAKARGHRALPVCWGLRARWEEFKSLASAKLCGGPSGDRLLVAGSQLTTEWISWKPTVGALPSSVCINLDRLILALVGVFTAQPLENATNQFL